MYHATKLAPTVASCILLLAVAAVVVVVAVAATGAGLGVSGGVVGAAAASQRRGHGSGRAVLLKNATIDDALVNARGLEAGLGDVITSANGLLEQAKVELTLAAHVVGHSVGDLGELVGAGRVKDLGGAIGVVSFSIFLLSYTNKFLN